MWVTRLTNSLAHEHQGAHVEHSSSVAHILGLPEMSSPQLSLAPRAQMAHAGPRPWHLALTHLPLTEQAGARLLGLNG